MVALTSVTAPDARKFRNAKVTANGERRAGPPSLPGRVKSRVEIRRRPINNSESWKSELRPLRVLADSRRR